ncbi:hypothetical protein [Desulfurispora thermophila]|uniref:hypothetical protein n=1 Tax=Desulfurispora thermophila TaxID=265470 RepID=UPI00037A657F|nr:hypothetical protein [Desulfurispora thermophila]
MWEELLGKVLAGKEEREQALLMSLANLFALTGVLSKLTGVTAGAGSEVGQGGLEPLLFHLLEQRRAGGGEPGMPLDPAWLVKLLAGHLPPQQAALLGILSSLWGGAPGTAAEAEVRRTSMSAPPVRDAAVGSAVRQRTDMRRAVEAGANQGSVQPDIAAGRRPGGRNRVLCWDPRLAGNARNNKQG